jgi:hypothetical protein
MLKSRPKKKKFSNYKIITQTKISSEDDHLNLEKWYDEFPEMKNSSSFKQILLKIIL